MKRGRNTKKRQRRKTRKKKIRRRRGRSRKGGRHGDNNGKNTKKTLSEQEKKDAAASAAAWRRVKRQRADRKLQQREQGTVRPDGRDPRGWVRYGRDPATNVIRSAQQSIPGQVVSGLGRGALSTVRGVWTMVSNRTQGGGGNGSRKVKRSAPKKTKRVRFPLAWDELRQTQQYSPKSRDTRKKWRKGYPNKRKGEKLDDTRYLQRQKVFGEWDSARLRPSTPFQLGLADYQTPCRFETARRLDRCRQVMGDLKGHDYNKGVVNERFTSAGRSEDECQSLIKKCENELLLMNYLLNNN